MKSPQQMPEITANNHNHEGCVPKAPTTTRLSHCAAHSSGSAGSFFTSLTTRHKRLNFVSCKKKKIYTHKNNFKNWRYFTYPLPYKATLNIRFLKYHPFFLKIEKDLIILNENGHHFTIGSELQKLIHKKALETPEAGERAISHYPTLAKCFTNTTSTVRMCQEYFFNPHSTYAKIIS